MCAYWKLVIFCTVRVKRGRICLVLDAIYISYEYSLFAVIPTANRKLHEEENAVEVTRLVVVKN